MAKACRKHQEFLLEGKAGDTSEPVPGTGLGGCSALCFAMLGSDLWAPQSLLFSILAFLTCRVRPVTRTDPLQEL